MWAAGLTAWSLTDGIGRTDELKTAIGPAEIELMTGAPRGIGQILTEEWHGAVSRGSRLARWGPGTRGRSAGPAGALR